MIKEDKIIIHHVSDGKVYFKGSPDSDFLNRDLLVAVNKHQSRENGTKMKASYQTKAAGGWWPYRHTPLGYIHSKERDQFGNPIKGTAKLIPHPDERVVKLVQKEFELRAQGFSHDQIREQNIASGLVPLDLVKTYSRAAIAKRLHYPLYWGQFSLTGDPTVYQGKHELIIPSRTLKAVAAINAGKNRHKRHLFTEGGDIFKGWIRCTHPDCNRLISYDPKPKKLKSTGEETIYHYYACPNDLKVHEKRHYTSEKKIWEQFEPAIGTLAINEGFAQDISNALNETHEKQKAAIKKQMEGFRFERDKLRAERNSAVSMYATGKISETAYGDFIKDVDRRDDHFANEIERLHLLISDEAMVSVKKVFELAINAESLWKSMEREDRLAYLKKVVSNQTLDGLTLRYELQKPFARLALWKENSEWRTRVGEFVTDCLALAG